MFSFLDHMSILTEILGSEEIVYTWWWLSWQVRGEVNRVIEQARAGKLVGASLDGKVYLYVSAPDLQQSLTSLSGSNEGVDALHRIFLTSQVPTHSFP